MARETKVGLLAGLAFIICFAVILANRGHQDLIPAQLAYDGGSHPPSPAHSPARRTSSPADSNTLAIESPTPRRMPKRVPRSSGGDIAARSPVAMVEFPSDVPVAERSAQPAEQATNRIRRGTDQVAPAVASADPAGRRRVLKKRLDELSQKMRLESRSQGASADSPFTEASEEASAPTMSPPAESAAASAKLTRYTAVAGDTLSGIAARHYGSRSRRFVDAIFDANRTILPSPDELRIGVELILPVVPGGTAPRTDPAVGRNQPRSASPKPNAKESPHAKPFRWYQIKKNDRYISIAREQLGDAGRWREIYELNRASFPDPELIREGVRIKLPLVEVADAGKGRHR